MLNSLAGIKLSPKFCQTLCIMCFSADPANAVRFEKPVYLRLCFNTAVAFGGFQLLKACEIVYRTALENWATGHSKLTRTTRELCVYDTKHSQSTLPKVVHYYYYFQKILKVYA